jgi:uncharacterized protein YpbB
MLFYRLLHKHDGFQWSEQAKAAFQQFKLCLKNLPTLVPPKDGEVMYLYVVATHKVVSVFLVVEHRTGKSTKQHPVYFVSEVLHDA